MHKAPSFFFVCAGLLITCFLVLLLTPAAARAAIVRWTANGHCYEAVLAAGLTWQQAQDASTARGGYLATITSDAENCLIYSLFGSTSLGPWIGGHQLPGSPEPAGGWTWITGEPFSYTNWAPGEPNNCSCGAPDENAIAFFTGLGCLWNDIGDLSTTTGSYIFETENCPPNAVDITTPIVCCQVTAVTRATWGQIKTIYR